MIARGIKYPRPVSRVIGTITRQIPFVAAFLTFVCLAAPAALAAPDCHLREQASLDMTTTADGRVTVPVVIDGHEEYLLIGTADTFSALQASAVRTLGLTTRWIGSNSMEYWWDANVIAEANTIQVGRLKSQNMTFLRKSDGDFGKDAVGVFGADLLTGHDLELDPRHRKLNLFSPDHCPEQVVYWTRSPYARIKMHVDTYGIVTIPIVLDGKRMTAFIDTSASRSFIDVHEVRYYFGWQDDPPNLKLASGFQNGDRYREYYYPFKTLTFEGVTVSNPKLTLYLNSLSGPSNGPTISLGMDILRQLHIYIAYGEGYLYATAADAQ